MGKRYLTGCRSLSRQNDRKITTAHRVGEVSSKYGYQPELFEEKVDPERLRYLFLRLWEEFLK